MLLPLDILCRLRSTLRVRTLFILVVSLVLHLFFTTVPSLSQTDGSRVELEVAIHLWNTAYSDVAHCSGIVDSGGVSDEWRERLLAIMTDPSNVYMLSGELTEQGSLTFARASDNPLLVSSAEFAAYCERVHAYVDASTRWYLLEFQLPDGACVESYVVASDSNCIYNSILSESFYIEPMSFAGTVCESWEARNFLGYGWKVGEVIVEVIPQCDRRSGCLIACNHRCVAWVWIGTVERNRCNVTRTNQCCTLNYDIVVRSGLWIRIGVPIGIGSTLALNGSCTACCRCVDSTPVLTPRTEVR